MLLQLPTLVGAAVVLDHSGASVRILAAYCRLSHPYNAGGYGLFRCAALPPGESPLAPLKRVHVLRVQLCLPKRPYLVTPTNTSTWALTLSHG